MKHNNSTLKLQLLTLLAAVLSGCATEPSATQKEFGSSVKHMISAQTYEPGDEITGLDGEKSRGLLIVTGRTLQAQGSGKTDYQYSAGLITSGECSGWI